MPGRNTAFLPEDQFKQIRTTYPRFNEPWLNEEVEELREMAVDGISRDDMAMQLQRTPNSVRLKLKALGLYVPKPTPPRWTKDEDQALVEMYNDGEPFEDMSARFDRSVNAVITRLVHLRANLFDKEG